jgi:hypothetical protein
MLRKIVDYQKLNEEILNLLVDKFPDGYSDADIITFRNADNEVVEAVEISTEDTIYLVKIGKRLIAAMEDFDQEEVGDNEDDNDNDDSETYELPNEELE